ncbi:MAG: hypothetical protein ACJ77K_08355 [Bacteroidia bacterium]
MKHSIESLYEDARLMYLSGKDDRYITFQFAEAGISDDVIDEVLLQLKKLKRGMRRHAGMKQLIYGASFMAVAILFSFISTKEGSPLVYVLWGLAVSGVMMFIRGFALIVGLI